MHTNSTNNVMFFNLSLIVTSYNYQLDSTVLILVVFSSALWFRCFLHVFPLDFPVFPPRLFPPAVKQDDIR